MLRIKKDDYLVLEEKEKMKMKWLKKWK
jgi:hypothetical protein